MVERTSAEGKARATGGALEGVLSTGVTECDGKQRQRNHSQDIRATTCSREETSVGMSEAPSVHRKQRFYSEDSHVFLGSGSISKHAQFKVINEKVKSKHIRGGV